MKLKLLTFSFFAVFGGGLVYGQQDLTLSHFVFHKMMVNPGETGIDDGICATSTYRNQWERIAGAPVSTVLNVEANMNRFFPGGIGLTVYHDAIAFNRQNNFSLSYSYPLDVPGYGTLGVGLSAGLINLGLSPEWVPPSTMNDVTLPVASSALSLDLNFGLYFKGDKDYYIGLSSTHLTESPLALTSTTGNVNYDVVRHYYIMGGKKFNQVIPNLDVDANLFVQTDMVKTSFFVNGRAIWANRYYGGLGFRNADAISLMFGFMPIRNFTIGYAYDLNAPNELSSISKGTNEVMLKYCYYLPPPPIQKSKHPRWL